MQNLLFENSLSEKKKNGGHAKAGSKVTAGRYMFVR